MLLLGEINKVTFLPARKEGDTGMYQLALTDKSKPAQFRTATLFVMFMQQAALDKLVQQNGGKTDLTDLPVTVAVGEIGTYNNLPKLRGSVFVGHMAGEALEKRITDLESKAAKTEK